MIRGRKLLCPVYPPIKVRSGAFWKAELLLPRQTGPDWTGLHWALPLYPMIKVERLLGGHRTGRRLRKDHCRDPPVLSACCPPQSNLITADDIIIDAKSGETQDVGTGVCTSPRPQP